MDLLVGSDVGDSVVGIPESFTLSDTIAAMK
jgi:hypothetical protein